MPGMTLRRFLPPGLGLLLHGPELTLLRRDRLRGDGLLEGEVERRDTRDDVVQADEEARVLVDVVQHVLERRDRIGEHGEALLAECPIVVEQPPQPAVEGVGQADAHPGLGRPRCAAQRVAGPVQVLGHVVRAGGDPGAAQEVPHDVQVRLHLAAVDVLQRRIHRLERLELRRIRLFRPRLRFDYELAGRSRLDLCRHRCFAGRLHSGLFRQSGRRTLDGDFGRRHVLAHRRRCGSRRGLLLAQHGHPCPDGRNLLQHPRHRDLVEGRDHQRALVLRRQRPAVARGLDGSVHFRKRVRPPDQRVDPRARNLAVFQGVHHPRQHFDGIAQQRQQLRGTLASAFDYPVDQPLDGPGEIPHPVGAHHAAAALQRVKGAPHPHQRLAVRRIALPQREHRADRCDFLACLLDEHVEEFLIELIDRGPDLGRPGSRRFCGRWLGRGRARGGGFARLADTGFPPGGRRGRRGDHAPGGCGGR
ncbi:MAG: hypothetical protein AMJ58_11890, partial [Gammaproteobacteria bacterium SG8_30]